jgi:molecular chaperone GrpE
VGDEPLDHDDQATDDHDDEATRELARLVELVAQAGQELVALRAEVARDHERAAARERIIDRLHDDNQKLRAGERHLLLRPLLTDLQRLRHELLRTAAALPESFSGEQAAELLRSYAYNLELTLERGGIAVVAPEPGATFDPSAQRAAGAVETADPAHDGTVAEVVLDGYHDTLTDRIVAPATVRVHRWTPVPETDAAMTIPFE